MFEDKCKDNNFTQRFVNNEVGFIPVGASDKTILITLQFLLLWVIRCVVVLLLFWR